MGTNTPNEAQREQAVAVLQLYWVASRLNMDVGEVLTRYRAHVAAQAERGVAMPMVPERITDAMDTRAMVTAICDGLQGDQRLHDAYSVLGCFEGQFSSILRAAGWRAIGHGRKARWICAACAQGIEDSADTERLKHGNA